MFWFRCFCSGWIWRVRWKPLLKPRCVLISFIVILQMAGGDDLHFSWRDFRRRMSRGCSLSEILDRLLNCSLQCSRWETRRIETQAFFWSRNRLYNFATPCFQLQSGAARCGAVRLPQARIGVILLKSFAVLVQTLIMEIVPNVPAISVSEPAEQLAFP